MSRRLGFISDDDYLDVKQITDAVDRSRLHGDSSMRETDTGVCRVMLCVRNSLPSRSSLQLSERNKRTKRSSASQRERERERNTTRDIFDLHKHGATREGEKEYDVDA